MRHKLKSIIKLIFGTQDNISSKLSFSLFITGIWFFLFALMLQNSNNPQALNTFTYISAILLGIWLASIQGNNSILEIIKEAIRLIFFFIILVFSLNFCVNSSLALQGRKLLIYSTFACIGLLASSFYLVSKFVDIFNFVKKLFNQIKSKLFNTIQTGETEQKATKLKSFIENITTFLVSIAGLGVAIKAIVEPLINTIQLLLTP